MKFCPKCKKDYLTSELFCCDCGVELKKRREPRCPKCKTMVWGRFCSKCGLEFDEKLLKRAKIKI